MALTVTYGMGSMGGMGGMGMGISFALVSRSFRVFHTGGFTHFASVSRAFRGRFAGFAWFHK